MQVGRRVWAILEKSSVAAMTLIIPLEIIRLREGNYDALEDTVYVRPCQVASSCTGVISVTLG